MKVPFLRLCVDMWSADRAVVDVEVYIQVRDKLLRPLLYNATMCSALNI